MYRPSKTLMSLVIINSVKCYQALSPDQSDNPGLDICLSKSCIYTPVFDSRLFIRHSTIKFTLSWLSRVTIGSHSFSSELDMFPQNKCWITMWGLGRSTRPSTKALMRMGIRDLGIRTSWPLKATISESKKFLNLPSLSYLFYSIYLTAPKSN